MQTHAKTYSFNTQRRQPKLFVINDIFEHLSRTYDVMKSDSKQSCDFRKLQNNHKTQWCITQPSFSLTQVDSFFVPLIRNNNRPSTMIKHFHSYFRETLNRNLLFKHFNFFFIIAMHVIYIVLDGFQKITKYGRQNILRKFYKIQES